MAEIIITVSGNAGSPGEVRFHPWVYPSVSSEPMAALLRIMPGLSPMREALIERGVLPEQELERWTDVPLDRTSCWTPVTLEQTAAGDLVSRLVRKLHEHAVRWLEENIAAPVEYYAREFGAIMAVPADDALIGIAVESSWPCRVLEVDWIDREKGLAIPCDVDLPKHLLVPEKLRSLVEEIRARRPGTNVDSSAT